MVPVLRATPAVFVGGYAHRDAPLAEYGRVSVEELDTLAAQLQLLCEFPQLG